MYACLYQFGASPEATSHLARLARCFSPEVEITGPGTVVFSIGGLQRLIGSPDEIAAEIARRGAEQSITANLAIAAAPDAAILAALHLTGVTFIPAGREAETLGRIHLARLSLPRELQETLERWGLRTLSDVAELPPIGLAERLGEQGVRLYDLALGRSRRPLNLAPEATSYTERMDLDEPVSQLEPLLFLISRLLNDLCLRMASNAVAANRLSIRFDLEDGREYARTLELPMPQQSSPPLLKLLHLELEAHPPEAAVAAIRLDLNPVSPRKVQGGLFVPQAPEPAKLQVTLARLRGLAGEENVGSPELKNTHRPDAFRMKEFTPPERSRPGVSDRKPKLVLALRLFRPPRPARVRTVNSRPGHVAAAGVAGQVVEASGPWRSSGDWWSREAWDRDEWDVALGGGGLYRLSIEFDSREWFVQGVYD